MSVIDDAVLLKMAEHEILGEAKRAAVRYSVAGVSGWQPCFRPNKKFLTNTLLQTMASNRIQARNKGNKTSIKKSERKLLRTNAVEKSSNFLYQKPAKIKKKPTLHSSSNECSQKMNKSKHTQSQSAKETKIFNIINIKLKNKNKNKLAK